jgi:hypothetical protein
MQKTLKIFRVSADRTGLEPATSAVTGRHSNQLNYRSSFLAVARQDDKNTAFLGTAKIGDLPAELQKFFYIFPQHSR